MESEDFYELNKDKITMIYSDFNVVELPAGYIGEVHEAIQNLEKNKINVNNNTIISYITLKAALMNYLRENESELVSKYPEKRIKKRAAGIIIPEWLISTTIILGFFVDLVALGSIIYNLLKKEFPDEKKTKIKQVAENIINIKEAKDFNIIINQEKDS